MDGGDKLRIGIIGLGDIARKAYLPTLLSRPGVDPYLMTRDATKLAGLAEAHRVPVDHCFTDLDALLERPLDAAFVHAPTDQHVSIAERLIDEGIALYVDKPLDSTLEGARRVVERAERAGVTLMVGFNRRYAPGYVKAREAPRDLVVLQKNQPGIPGSPRTVVYDDFIHVVDTLRFLAPGEIRRADVTARVEAGDLHHVTLRLAGDGFTLLGLMSRFGGAKEERLEVTGGGRKRVVIGLAEEIDHDGGTTVTRRGDWTPVARQRGIEQACSVFLDAVREGRPLDARDALRTHELCERVVVAIEAEG
ncbi:Gfo/Idh/MocA family protein [Marinactinospora thermotolerans]|uniref:Virulence factor n=1 Tax=Marinactinospora thermotolerans DSM 45154 TaxID=1122192 RepID=A0A1T4RBC9_9ACTN|nr:Gfo/Idh/MocA family oxidoreductase [Marinactinospora thermotolerans]SKA13008.1 virulence factor [Marinactinospora thermotolerans DSM 45154]